MLSSLTWPILYTNSSILKISDASSAQQQIRPGTGSAICPFLSADMYLTTYPNSTLRNS